MQSLKNDAFGASFLAFSDLGLGFGTGLGLDNFTLPSMQFRDKRMVMCDENVNENSS